MVGWIELSFNVVEAKMKPEKSIKLVLEKEKRNMFAEAFPKWSES